MLQHGPLLFPFAVIKVQLCALLPLRFEQTSFNAEDSLNALNYDSTDVKTGTEVKLLHVR